MSASRPEWWRLRKGLTGLKRIMPDRSIQWAEAHGYGWPRHYEPVCSDCPCISTPTHAGKGLSE